MAFLESCAAVFDCYDIILVNGRYNLVRIWRGAFFQISLPVHRL